MNYNPTPKESFLQDKSNLEAHHSLVTSEALRYALSVAQLQYGRLLAQANPADLGSAAMLHMRQKGVEEFLEIFLNLAETAELPKVVALGNLPGNKPATPK